MSGVIVAGTQAAQVIAAGGAQQQVVATKQPASSVVLAGMRGPKGDSSVPQRHNQAAPEATWTINHNLGYQPSSVAAYSVGGRLMLAEILHTSDNQCLVLFDSPTAGYALYS